MLISTRGIWASDIFFAVPWIGPDKTCDACRLKTEFSIDRPVYTADVYVAARGGYRLYVNGQDIGPLGLQPHSQHPDSIVYADVYRVKGRIEEGHNTICLQLCRTAIDSLVGAAVMMVINYRDGTSDTLSSRSGEWIWSADGGVSQCQGAVVYDARRCCSWDEGEWHRAEEYKEWKATIVQNPLQPLGNILADTGSDYLSPISVKDEGHGIVMDFGREVYGNVWLPISNVSAGDSVFISYDGGKGDSFSLADIYVANGNERHTMFMPDFRQKHFRRILVSGMRAIKADEVMACQQLADLLPIGFFTSSDAALNHRFDSLRDVARMHLSCLTPEYYPYLKGYSYVYDTEQLIETLDIPACQDAAQPCDSLAWMFRELGGIGEISEGDNKVVLSPDFVAAFKMGLTRVECSLDTRYGIIRSTWQRTPDGLVTWHIETPEDIEAVIPRELRECKWIKRE